MQKLLLASVAGVALVASSSVNAADVDVIYYRAPPLAAATFFSWTGCYIGGHIGGGFGHKEWADVPGVSSFVGGLSAPQSISANPSGFLGGGQIGCNYQFMGGWVAGIDGDFSGAETRGTSSPDPFNQAKVFTARTDWLASATGRVGYSWDRWLVYVKGGAAWAGDRYHVHDNLGFDYDASETRTGWTVGVGIEWAFWNNWSAKLEYDFYGFGNRNVEFCIEPGCTPFAPVDVRQEINVVKLGITYRFWGGFWPGPAPVVAKY